MNHLVSGRSYVIDLLLHALALLHTFAVAVIIDGPSLGGTSMKDGKSAVRHGHIFA